jgi:hypothetical protein
MVQEMNIVTPQEIFAEILGAQVISCEVTDDGMHFHLGNGKLLIICGRQVIAYVEDDMRTLN